MSRRIAHTLTLTALTLTTLALIPSLVTAKSPVVSHDTPTLNLDASLSHKALPNRTATEVYASIKVEGREFVSERRAPLNIALVIDRSGSMEGEKIAQARQAALKLVDQLVEGDRLSLVVYGDEVATLANAIRITPEGRATLKRAIQNITVDGYTHLSGGFETGCKLVANTVQQHSVNRVLLMSDGQANVGVTDPHALATLASTCLERGVSLSTIGIGLDYNEDIMTQMAIAGAGNYHFIDKEEAMARVFTQEATSLASTVARKTTLTIDLAPGVELLSLRGYRYTAKGNTITIPLSEFSSKQRKDVLLKLSVSAQESGQRQVLSARLRYEDSLNARSGSQHTKLAAQVTQDEKVVAAQIDREVVSHAQKVEVAQTMQDSMKAYERGDRKQAAAILSSQRESMNRARATYSFEDDGDYARVEAELSEMESTVKTTEASSEEGKHLQKAKKKRSYDISNAEAAF